MPTVKKLQFANGVVVVEPEDLTLEASTNKLPTYADDAGYDAAHDVTEGSIYLNSTLKAPRMYLGGVWRTGIMQSNAADATKQLVLDTDGSTTGKTNTLDFNSTDNRVYTFPDATGTVVLTLGAQELQDKTIKNGFLDGTKIRNGAIDVEAAGALTIGSTVGANNLTLGGASTNVQIPGNLTVSGTTTTVNTDSLDVEDKNITVSKGGNDAVSEGAGITVDRTGTKGSLIYKAAAQNKFAIGDLGAEKDIATMFDITALNLSGVVTPANGGTGVSNNNAATLTRSGNHAVTLTTTDVTSVTLPTSGTLATTADITMANLTGTLVPSKGGTGVSNNNAATLTRTGDFDLNITTTAASAVTMPLSGTLATRAGTEDLSNKTLIQPVVDNFAAFNQESTPTAAAAGTVRVYAKADNKLYKMDSTGAETAIGSGSGSGGVNYLIDWYDSSKPVGTVLTVAASGNIVVSGSAPAVTSAWYADSTSGAAAIAASTSTLLRGSSNYLTALSGVSTSGATFVQSPAFNIDGSDLGKPVTISFDVSGVTTIDDWDVIVARYTVSGTTGTFAELISVAGNASAITGTPGAEIPTGTVQFKGFFIPSATSTDVYALRLRRRAGATQIRVDSLTVGPQSLAQGAIVTAWQNYTPTLTNFGSKGTTRNEAAWRRVGTDIEIKFSYTGDATAAGAGASVLLMSLPSGLTFDSSKSPTPGTLTDDDYFGTYREYSIATNATYSSVQQVYPNSSTTFRFVKQGTGGSLITSDLNVARPTYITGEIKAPIAEWASSTTTLADRAVEEYAYNTDTTNANNTSSFGYGADGALFPNRTVGTAVSKQVRFQTAILPTDRITLEYQQAGLGSWREGSQLIPKVTANTAIYGAYIDYVSSTDITVIFAPNGAGAFGAATYGANGEAWSAYNTAGWKWRVRKVSGGAAVGYPVSARNIVGDTSGTAVTAGMLGEQLSQTWTGQTILTSGTTLATHSSVQPGVYLFIIETDCSKGSATRIVSDFAGTATISVTRTAIGGDYITTVDASAAALYATYYVRVTGAGTITFTSRTTTANATSSRGSFSIVRIA
jgi:hypothetical protein